MRDMFFVLLVGCSFVVVVVVIVSISLSYFVTNAAVTYVRDVCVRLFVVVLLDAAVAPSLPYNFTGDILKILYFLFSFVLLLLCNILLGEDNNNNNNCDNGGSLKMYENQEKTTIIFFMRLSWCH